MAARTGCQVQVHGHLPDVLQAEERVSDVPLRPRVRAPRPGQRRLVPSQRGRQRPSIRGHARVVHPAARKAVCRRRTDSLRRPASRKDGCEPRGRERAHEDAPHYSVLQAQPATHLLLLREGRVHPRAGVPVSPRDAGPGGAGRSEREGPVLRGQRPRRQEDLPHLRGGQTNPRCED